MRQGQHLGPLSGEISPIAKFCAVTLLNVLSIARVLPVPAMPILQHDRLRSEVHASKAKKDSRGGGTHPPDDGPHERTVAKRVVQDLCSRAAQ